MRRLALVVLLVLAASVVAQPPKLDPQRWEKEIAAIEQRDKDQKAPEGGVLFLGSSSIRLWNLKQSFPDLDAVNHGFGGSTIADSVYYVDRLVSPLKPRIIVFYAGDNDINSGKSPQEVHADFQAFAKAVHAKLPETKILYVPIKPSPKRFAQIEKQREANRLIKETIDKDSQRLVYVDVVASMLDDQGRPRPELFQKDELHLSDAGYALWNRLLLPHLK